MTKHLQQLAEAWRLKASGLEAKFTSSDGTKPLAVQAATLALEMCAEDIEQLLKTPPPESATQ